MIVVVDVGGAGMVKNNIIPVRERFLASHDGTGRSQRLA